MILKVAEYVEMMARTLQPRSTTRPGAGRQALRRPTVAAASEPHEHQIQAPPAPAQLHRRAWLAAAAAAALAPLPPAARAEQQAPAVEILADAPGSGTARARQGDLVLVHYVGTVAGSGALFDSTRGGQVGMPAAAADAWCVIFPCARIAG